MCSVSATNVLLLLVLGKKSKLMYHTISDENTHNCNIMMNLMLLVFRSYLICHVHGQSWIPQLTFTIDD